MTVGKPGGVRGEAAELPVDPAASMSLGSAWSRLALVWLIQGAVGWSLAAVLIFLIVRLALLHPILMAEAEQRFGLAGQFLVLAIVIPGVAVLVALFTPMLRRTILAPDPEREDLPLGGVALSRADQPRLWDRVDAVARRLDSPSPQRLWLYLDPEMSIRHFPSRSGRRPGGDWELACGLPILAACDTETFAALVAIAMEDVRRRSRLVYRLAAGRVETLVQNMTEQTLTPSDDIPNPRWGEGLSLRLAKLLVPVVRHAGYQAFRRAAAAVGPEAVVKAAEQRTVLAFLGDRYLSTDVVSALRNELRPPLVEGLQRFLGTEHNRLQWAAIEARMVVTWDPEISAWILPAQIRPGLGIGPATTPESRVSGPPVLGGESAAELIEDLDQIELRLIGARWPNLGTRSLQPCGWDAIGAALVPKFRDRALAALPVLDGITLDQVPTFAVNPRAFAARMGWKSGDGSDLAMLYTTAEVLAAAITVVLADRGWQVDLSPDVAFLTLRHGEQSLAPEDAIVQMFHHRRAVDRWREDIVAEGLADLDIGAALTPAL